MGALTLKVFSDELREWEFIEGEGIDPTDSFGVNLRLSIRENQVFLAEPNDPSTPWLTDKGRLFFEGMFDDSSTSMTNWESFFSDISELMYFIDHLNLHKRDVFSLIFAFENLSLETLNILYLLKQSCSLVELRKVDSHKGLNDFESDYQLNSSTEKAKLHLSTLGILVNTNPRYEGYVLNLSLRQRFLKGNFKLFNVGSVLDLTFPTYNLGSNFNVLKHLAEGTHLACQDVKNSEFPVIITNVELFKRSDAKIFTEVLKHVSVIDAAWNSTNVLNHNIGSAGIQSLSKFLPLSTEDLISFFGLYYINVSLGSTANMKKLIELHLLNIFQSKNTLLNKCFIDQNSVSVNEETYEKGQHKLFNNYFYLPASLFLEDNETYINTQGFIKRTTKLINFKKDSKTNWQITRKFYANSKSIAFFNNTKDNNLINFDCVNSFNFKNYTNFQFYAVQTLTSFSSYLTKKNKPFVKSSSPLLSTKTKVLNTKLKGWLDDFFNSNGKDSFSYNSYTLVNCSKIVRTSTTNFF
uniref:NADH dehydrogenase subunit 11 n=1 Tax=Nitzschia sp. NIES-3576 TaxID=2083273 RepID=A0A2Z5ZBB3_9STRA|nr:NADH dehydrogenase subunit 11 [Nitzschia sp. NIES-3576]